MGMHLMLGAMILGAFSLGTLVLILKVAIGLGMVIFVHELGHFAVAKMCGVKCEKFYLGFGPPLFRFRKGETEYGIGILPLGGYVKMLGQDDNPTRAAEERQRTQIKTEGGNAGSESYTLDPRSYMAQSVPERMAIISAGVVMNVIFAFLFAIVAFYLGVKDVPCAISEVIPGEAACQADLRPGDQVIEINDKPTSEPLDFGDLMTAVALGDISQGVKFKVKRIGVEQPFTLLVRPDVGNKARLRPTIGAVPAVTTTLSKEFPVDKFTPASAAEKFQPEDKIVAVGDDQIDSYAALIGVLARRAGEKLPIVVERTSGETTQKVTIEVPPRPLKSLGLTMKIGPITAVQANSPAAEAGIKAGDFIESIDGKSPNDWDPMTLDDRLREVVGETIPIAVSRPADTGKTETVTVQVKVRDAGWFERPFAPGVPMSAPTLGISYRVLNVIHRVEDPALTATPMKDDKPAEMNQLVAGNVVAKAQIVATAETEKDEELRGKFGLSEPVEFSDEEPNWPVFMFRVQAMLPTSRVKLTLLDGRTVLLTPGDSPEAFNPERGFNYQQAKFIRKATSLGEASSLAARETWDSIMQVVATLRAVGSGRVSAKNFGGIGMIATVAGYSASEGMAQLLIFLTMISANLAVINFLPIPVLDGGHMVFLAWEGIFGRPPSERVQGSLTYAGLALILGLIVFVNALDVQRFLGWL